MALHKVPTTLSQAELAQLLLTIRGEQYSLKDYPMFVKIFNSGHRRRLMRSGRQVSKTTVMGADIATTVTTTPYLEVIYCNSSAAQTAAFSATKLNPFLKQSPYVYHNLFTRGSASDDRDSVFTKIFKNNATILMSYFSENADRVRGKSGQRMYLDEVQDMLWDAMIDAEECLSAAEDPRFVYAGTSKSMNTPLEFLWQESTQQEWVIKCQGCGSHNRPSHANIGKKGIICKKCGHSLNTYDGQWISFAKQHKDKPHFVDGYWIPQIIMPMHCLSEEKWSLLLNKREVYSEVKFDNEVMGLPSGEGDSPITEDMVRAMCLPELRMLDVRCPENSDGARFIAAGIDWGGGGVLGVSRTVLSIYAVYPEQPLYKKIFGKIYTEGEPTKHVEDIAMWLGRFGVTMVCGDHGGGNLANNLLKSLVPPHLRIIPVMYSDASAPFRWDEAARRYTVNRTAMIDAFFMDMQQGTVRTFRWEEFEPFARDILNIRQEFIGEDRGANRRVWRHSPALPDDSLHSMVFGWFACRVLSGRMDFSNVM